MHKADCSLRCLFPVHDLPGLLISCGLLFSFSELYVALVWKVLRVGWQIIYSPFSIHLLNEILV